MYTSENVSEQVTNQALFNSEKPTYRLTPAGPDHASVAACAGMIDYYEEIYEHHFGKDTSGLRDRIVKVFDLFGEHEEQLMTPLINYILSRKISDLLVAIQQVEMKGLQRLLFILRRQQVKQFMMLLSIRTFHVVTGTLCSPPHRGNRFKS